MAGGHNECDGAGVIQPRWLRLFQSVTVSEGRGSICICIGAQRKLPGLAAVTEAGLLAWL